MFLRFYGVLAGSLPVFAGLTLADLRLPTLLPGEIVPDVQVKIRLVPEIIHQALQAGEDAVRNDEEEIDAQERDGNSAEQDNDCASHGSAPIFLDVSDEGAIQGRFGGPNVLERPLCAGELLRQGVYLFILLRQLLTEQGVL